MTLRAPAFRCRNGFTYCNADNSNDKVSVLTYILSSIRLQLHGAIYRPDSFVFMLRYCGNLKAIRYESTSLNRIVADKSHRVIVA